MSAPASAAEADAPASADGAGADADGAGAGADGAAAAAAEEPAAPGGGGKCGPRGCAEGMDPEATVESNFKPEMCYSFADMNLCADLCRGIDEYLTPTDMPTAIPSAMQMRAVVPCIQGHDTLVQAQSGTGKTCTFVLAVLQTVVPENEQCQAIVLTPTRELAQAIQRIFVGLGRYMKIECMAVTMTSRMVHDDMRRLKAGGVHCVIGSVGQIYASIQQRALNLASVRQIIVANADEVFDRGFRDQLYDLFRQFPNLNPPDPAQPAGVGPVNDAASASNAPTFATGELQLWWSDPDQDAAGGRAVCRSRKEMVWTVMHVAHRLETTLQTEALEPELWMLIFTFVKHERQPSPQVILTVDNGSWHTVSREVVDFAKHFMRNPVQIVAKRDERSMQHVKHFYVNCEREEWKLETLCDIYEIIVSEIGGTPTIIFCNGRRQTDALASTLPPKMHAMQTAEAPDVNLDLNVDLTQQERDAVLQQICPNGSPNGILIITDRDAQSLDVEHVPLIINYDIPRNCENYIHRIYCGTGMVPRSQIVINFITADDIQHLRRIEMFYNIQIEEMPMNIADLIKRST